MATKSRLLLVCTLGGLLLMTAAVGIAGLLIFEHIRTSEAALRAGYLERSGTLERIRAAIYASGTLARDYFADPKGPDAAVLLDRVARLEEESKQALERYAASGAAANQSVAKLRGEVITYWRLLDLMSEMARTRRTPGVDAYFRGQLRQRRETMLEIAGQISAALDRERRSREAALARIYAQFRGILAAGLTVVLVLGSVIAAATTRRLLRLEGETRALSAQLAQAQEQERRSIARELHDEVGQSLTSLLLDVSAAASIAGPGTLSTRLSAISRMGERIVEEVRRIALSLRPSMLDDLGLVPAIEWQAREVGHRSGLAVVVDAQESSEQLPEAHRTCIYRVAQEALQNCVRHAQAKRIRIGLRQDAKTVSLRVEDDGKGFTAARTRGIGLLGMEERVLQLGGRLRVHSEPGRGTAITAELPV